MYKPAPVRPKKTNICRTKTGCKSCRARRKKCDEQKPSCGSCLKLGRPCEPVSQPFQFRNVSTPSNNSRISARRNGIVGKADIPAIPDAPWNDQVSIDVPLNGHNQLILSPSQFADGLTSPTLDFASLPLPIAQEKIEEFLSEIFGEESRTGRQLDPIHSLTPITEASSKSDVQHEQGSGSEHEITFSMTGALLPSHDTNNAMPFYITAWRDHCLPALHLSFHHIEVLCSQAPLIADVMVTLSACRLSRMMPQRKLLMRAATPTLCYRPDPGHESLSGEFYGAVLRKMTWWSGQDFDAYPVVGLAVLVVFCYLESSMGNFQEFHLHSEAVEKLIASHTSSIIPRSGGLLAAWVEIKMQNWWRRAHFPTPDFYINCSTSLLRPEVEASLSSAVDRRASVLWILCESHRLNNATLVACWNERSDDCQVMRTDGLAYSAGLLETVNTPSAFLLSEYEARMRTQVERLNEWYEAIPTSDLPELAEDGDYSEGFLGTIITEVKPLCFKNHAAAMNFAYYVAARVMQCTGPLQSLRNNSNIPDPDYLYEETERWILILLRITAGISWTECLRLNVYTIGLAGLLLACAIRSRSFSTGLWIQKWLESCIDEDGHEEGNFPLYQILDALRLVNRERSDGRDVFSLFQTVNDGGGSGKFGSYHSQCINSFLVYGRCRRTEELLSYYASAQEPSVR